MVEASSDYKDRQDELVELSLAIRDLVLRGEVEDDELLAVLEGSGSSAAVAGGNSTNRKA